MFARSIFNDLFAQWYIFVVEATAQKQFPRKCKSPFLWCNFVVCRYFIALIRAVAVCRVCLPTHSPDCNLPLKITEICCINLKMWYWIIAKVKLNQVFKKSEIRFIELNSLQIGFTTHHQTNGAATATIATETNQRERIMRDGHNSKKKQTEEREEKILQLFVTPAWCLMLALSLQSKSFVFA